MSKWKTLKDIPEVGEHGRCTVCGKMRSKYDFHSVEFRSRRMRCKQCLEQYGKDVSGPVPDTSSSTVPIKKRKCLKCDKVFVSESDYRICNECKNSEEYKNASGHY